MSEQNQPQSYCSECRKQRVARYCVDGLTCIQRLCIVHFPRGVYLCPYVNDAQHCKLFEDMKESGGCKLARRRTPEPAAESQ